LASRRLSARSIANPPGPLPTAEAPPEFRSHALTLPRADAGLRFDRALARALPQYSRALLKSWIESGAVQVEGRAPRPRDKVQGGEEVRIEAQLATQTPVSPEAIPLEVIHEDRALIIINKPAGLVVHPGAGNARHTLQNALLALDPKLARVPRAGLVHRLDKDTSGLLVVARTPEAHAALVAALVAREIGRQYLAVCTGAMTAGGTVDEPIGRHRIHRTRMAVRADGRRALTRYRIVQRFRAHTLARVELETGRTHQIRVHLAHIGRMRAGAGRGAARISTAGAARGASRADSPHDRPTPRVAGASARGHAAPARGAPEPSDMSLPDRAAPPGVLVPDWPAPKAVHAAFTLRGGGVSAPPYDSLNVGAHVGDEAAAVAENRQRVSAHLKLPLEPLWLEQVHGIEVLDLDAARSAASAAAPTADAAIARGAGNVCVMQVADCMPVLFASRDGSAVAAAHAGWRGLAGGVLEATVARLGVAPGKLIAWLGPAIGPRHFEVGGEVRAAFLRHDAGASEAFHLNARGRWQCDLGALARRRLGALGVTAVFGGAWCTYADAARFFSYRRDGQCGRMAALIWLG